MSPSIHLIIIAYAKELTEEIVNFYYTKDFIIYEYNK